MVEEIPSNIKNARLFRRAVLAAKNSSDRGRYLVKRPVSAYVGARLFVIFDRAHKFPVAGAAILHGEEIASVFKNFTTAKPNGVDYPVLPEFMKHLLAAGGEKIVCQEPLVDLYKSMGFVTVAHAHPLDKTEPDKYYLLHLPKPSPVQEFDTYEDAKGFTANLLRQNKLGAPTFH